MVPSGVAGHFVTTTAKIYALVRLVNIAQGSPVRFLWQRRTTGTTLADVTETTPTDYTEHVFMAYAFPDHPPFALGTYNVTLFVNGLQAATGSFTIVP